MNRQEFSAGTVVFIAIMTFVLLPCVVRSSIAQTAPAAAPLQNTLPQKNQAQQTAPQPAASQPAAPQNVAQGNFFKRLANAYKQDWKGTTPSGPAQAFRGDPAPINAPPFPFTTWPIGGTVTIGYPWTQSGPLMQAIWSGGHGDWWKKNGIQIYGWLNFGGNWSTSHNVSNGQALCGATPPLNCKYGNFPESYDEVGNSIQPDQEVIYIERQPDTVQTDHFDWGFRIANLWGLDYRFTTAYGIFSQQLLEQKQRIRRRPRDVLRRFIFSARGPGNGRAHRPLHLAAGY